MKFSVLLYAYLFLQLLAVAYIDFKYKKISNKWSLLNIILFCTALFVFPYSYSFKFETFFYPLAFLIVGFGLFALQIMGGGDSKYLFSFFLLIPEIYHETFMLYLLYTTVFVGSLLLIHNTIENFDKVIISIKIMDIKGIKSCYGTKFAYAPVILVSWIIFGWMIRKELIF